MQANRFENAKGWIMTKVDNFWTKAVFSKKVYHVHEDERKFIGLLATFVGTVINAGHCTVVIASSAHLQMLQAQLEDHGLRVEQLIEDHRYMPLSAEQTLPRFMIGSLPDEQLLFQCISGIFSMPKCKGLPIRTYREMSSILLEQGNIPASAEPGQLWTGHCDTEQLSLFCAYPKLRADICDSLKHMGIYHCKVVSGTDSVSNIFYTNHV